MSHEYTLGNTFGESLHSSGRSATMPVETHAVAKEKDGDASETAVEQNEINTSSLSSTAQQYMGKRIPVNTERNNETAIKSFVRFVVNSFFELDLSNYARENMNVYAFQKVN